MFDRNSNKQTVKTLIRRRVTSDLGLQPFAYVPKNGLISVPNSSTWTVLKVPLQTQITNEEKETIKLMAANRPALFQRSDQNTRMDRQDMSRDMTKLIK